MSDSRKRGRGGRGNGNGNGGSGSGSASVINVARRLYVHNLSYRVSWQDLKDHFRACGNVVYAEVMKMPDDPSKSKGCGIVEYETPQEAARAIRELADSELQGRPILVREDREDRDLHHR